MYKNISRRHLLDSIQPRVNRLPIRRLALSNDDVIDVRANNGGRIDSPTSFRTTTAVRQSHVRRKPADQVWLRSVMGRRVSKQYVCSEWGGWELKAMVTYPPVTVTSFHPGVGCSHPHRGSHLKSLRLITIRGYSDRV